MVCSQRRAFEELASSLLPELKRSALSLTRDPAAAEDLVQEALLKAHGAYDRFETGSNFRAWIQRILYNAFVSDFRKRRDRGERQIPDDLDAEKPAGIDPLTSDDLEALCERVEDPVKRALTRMNPEFRDVFLRAAIDDATNGEIARALNIPVGTVMSRMHRARSFLRHELANPH